MLRGLWIITVLCVVAGSLLPGDSAPIKALERLELSDKFEHFGAYAALAFLPAIHERRRLVIAMAAGSLALGIGLEFGQLHVYARSFEITDMAADALGICLGLAVGIPVRLSAALRGFLFPKDEDSRADLNSGPC